jgi:hypothetical protein
VTDPDALAPIVREVYVDADQATAYSAFADIGSWWPLETHPEEGDRTRTAILEDRQGGRLYEVAEDGTEHEWGTIQAWEPPNRFSVIWSLHAEGATEWSVSFTPEDGRTRVVVEHIGWQTLGSGDELRATYDWQWEKLLELFARSLQGG